MRLTREHSYVFWFDKRAYCQIHYLVEIQTLSSAYRFSIELPELPEFPCFLFRISILNTRNTGILEILELPLSNHKMVPFSL